MPATLDELANGDPLVIAEETYLLGDVRPDGARRAPRSPTSRSVATHPHAEAQVRRWLIANLPERPGRARRLDRRRRAGGRRRRVRRRGRGRGRRRAVRARRRSPHDIADTDGAVTRFVLLTRPAPPQPSTGNDRTTLVAYLREDHSGALLEILSEFATRAVNLTRIESRPTKGRIGQYCFSIDCEGHIADERVGDAIAALHRVCADVRYLGSYPRRDGEQGPVPTGRSDPEFVESRGLAGPGARRRGAVRGTGRCSRRCARPRPRAGRARAAAGSRRRRSPPRSGPPG